jgi:hypothetical protein
MPQGREERGVCQGAAPVEGGGDWERVVARLPEGWEQRAREQKAFARRREVRSAGGLLRLVLGAAVLSMSLRLVAWWADQVGIGRLSDVAVGHRLRKARPWLSVEVGLLLGLRRARWAGRAVRVRLVDATVISEPGSRGTDWRAHAVVDLESGALCGLELTDKHGAESLVRHPLEPGEIAVADRIHARRTDFGQLLARTTDLVVRIGWQNLPLETPAGDRLDLIDWLHTPLLGPTERAVLVQTPTGAHPLRLIATPLPPAQAEAARRRCRQNATKKGRTINQRTVFAAGFILLVTTLDPDTWPVADVLALYRCRWQIELLFKRLKSIWHLDHLRARDPDTIQAHLLAVILAALLAGEVAAAAPIPLEVWLDDRSHPPSRWRWESLWHDAILAAIRGASDLLSFQHRLADARRYLCDSPRQRSHQAADARHLLRSLRPHQERRCA